MKITKKKEFILTMLLFLSTSSVAFTQTSTLVAVGSDGRLVYTPDSNGNIVPDFSGVGYKNSEEPIPMVPVVLTVSAVSGDNTANVQLAIETVAAMAIQANGFRGAILFQSGTYEISGVLTISATGIVLRGQGNSTIFLAKGTTQYDFIEIGGSSYITEETTSTRGIVDSYVPYGVDEITVESGHTFSSGDQVLLHRIPNQTWIDTLGMNASGINWTPSQRSIKFQRRVVAVNGDTITLDAPVVDPIDPQYATATLTKFTDNRINNVGIENMRLESDYDTYPHLPGASSDENHAWAAIAFSANIRDAWVRSVDGYYFGYGLIDIADNAAFITIEASNMYDPVSITTGGRKYPFSNDGQRILFKDCFARGGRHSLETGSNTAGPVVFTNCSTQGSLADDGPHHRWSTGILYDNIQTERLNFQNRGTSGTGHGWAAGQSMMWNCTVSEKIIIQDPPSDHTNWAIGCITPEFSNVAATGGNAVEPYGIIESPNVHIASIPSLFEAQLNDRLSGNSGEVPAGPTELVANAVSYSQNTLNWTDTSSNETSFLVERQSIGGSFEEIAIVTLNTTSYDDYAVSPSTEYAYRVRAKNIFGESNYSNEVSVTTHALPPVPDTPGSLTATAISYDQIDLAWAANTVLVEGYVIERKTDGAFVHIDSVGGDVNVYGNAGLTPGTLYTFRVAAYNISGTSGYSNEASASAFVLPSFPARPTSLVATALGYRVIDITWTDRADNEDGVIIERKSTGSYEVIGSVSANIVAYSDSMIAIATKYTYRIAAFNAGGKSEYSNEATTQTEYAYVNIALNKVVNWSGQQDANPAANACDGDVTTRWSSEVFPQWMEIDLGADVSLEKSELISYRDRAYQYTLEVRREGGGYSLVVDRTNNADTGTIASPIIDDLGGIAARYIRITVVGARVYSGAWTSILEFRLFPSMAMDTSGEANGHSQLPERSALQQGYPNPFNSTTLIKYDLAENAHISISIYNILGQRVRSLIMNDQQVAGSYSIAWNANNDAGVQVSSGSYIVRMNVVGKTSSFVQTRKVLLLR